MPKSRRVCLRKSRKSRRNMRKGRKNRRNKTMRGGATLASWFMGKAPAPAFPSNSTQIRLGASPSSLPPVMRPSPSMQPPAARAPPAFRAPPSMQPPAARAPPSMQPPAARAPPATGTFTPPNLPPGSRVMFPPAGSPGYAQFVQYANSPAGQANLKGMVDSEWARYNATNKIPAAPPAVRPPPSMQPPATGGVNLPNFPPGMPAPRFPPAGSPGYAQFAQWANSPAGQQQLQSMSQSAWKFYNSPAGAAQLAARK